MNKIQSFFNFHNIPSIETQEAPQTSTSVRLVTDLDQFKTQYGEFRATQLETVGTQTGYNGQIAEVFVYQEAGEQGVTIALIESFAISLVPLLRSSKTAEIDLSVDFELTATQLGQLYYNICIVDYKFETKLLEENKSTYITKIVLGGVQGDLLEHEDFKFYQIMAKSKNHIRDLQNGRTNTINTFTLPEIIDQFVAENEPNVKITKFLGEEVREQGLNLHYQVGMSSRFPPLFINLTYNGNPDSDEYHALIGKGVIFDWGGCDIKMGEFLYWMFLDKGGACAVYGAFKGIVEAGLKVNVTCSIPFAENVIDGDSYRTSDIIESHYGPTVEISNTDAEGRLLLADAMSWTQRNYKVDSMIELSTLTGFCIAALGYEHGCMLSNHDCITSQLQEAGESIREKLWRLPMVQYIRDKLKTGPADISNYSGETDGGTIEGGCFLENFVDEGVRWVHIDVANTTIVFGEKFGPYSKGGSGFGVGFLMEHFRNISQQE